MSLFQVNSIIGSLYDIRPANWVLSEQYQTYAKAEGEEVHWQPDISYYISHVRRIADSKSLVHCRSTTNGQINQTLLNKMC